MKNVISTIMLACFVLPFLFLAACGGREPEPVMVERREDTLRNCAYLVNEVEVIEAKIHKLVPKTDKKMKNLAYGVAGYFMFFIPWLLVDFKNAEAKEYEAYRRRHAHLTGIAQGKGCEFIPRNYPSLKEIKDDYEMYNKGVNAQSGEVTPQTVPRKNPYSLISKV